MSIAKHSSYNLAGMLLPMLVSLITVPIYLQAIGIDRYGILALCWLLLGYLGFLEIGMGPALQQRIASLRFGNAADRADVFWSAMGLNVLAGVLGAVIVYYGAPLYFATLDGVGHVAAEIALTVPWLAASFPVIMLSSTLVGALKGREEFLVVNAISAASSVGMAVAPLIVALVAGPRLDRLVAASLAARILGVLVLAGACARAVPLGRPRAPRKDQFKSLLSFGGWVSLTSILTPLASSVDRLAVGSVIGASAVSIYVIPFNLCSRTKVVPQALASALFPRFAALDETKRERLELDALAATAAIMTPLTLLALVVIGPFLRVWLGESLAVKSEPVAYVLLAGWWINSFARVSMARLQGAGKPKLVTQLLLWELPFYGAALYYLMSVFGVVGAAVAWSLRAAVDPFAMTTLNGTVGKFCAVIWLPALLIVVGMAAGLALPYAARERWLLLAVVAAIGVGWAWKNRPPPVLSLMSAVIGRIASVGRQRNSTG